MNPKQTIGILAHVDAGKTTLSEAMLFLSGALRRAGRVDHGDTFLDTDSIERARGITIFSKQARFSYGGTDFTLLDTPGHVDFSAETERTLQVLSAAILVISGTDGVQGHTRTLWRLLDHYQVPVFLFVNKMDLPGADRAALMENLRKELSGSCLDFTPLFPDEAASGAAAESAAGRLLLLQRPPLLRRPPMTHSRNVLPPARLIFWKRRRCARMRFWMNTLRAEACREPPSGRLLPAGCCFRFCSVRRSIWRACGP